MAADGRRGFQREVRHIVGRRFVLLQHRHHVGDLPFAHLSGIVLYGNRRHSADATDKEIAKANASSISQPKAEDVPDCVDKLATAIAGGQSKGGEAAQALADKLRESGWFSHGLNGDYPSRAGHGNYRIDQLLAAVRWSETASNTLPRWRLWPAVSACRAA